MTPPLAGDPCLEPLGSPAVAGGRVRVVEILATGTNGGAQEHLYSLLSRLDTSRYDASVISLSGGSAVRKLQRAGFPVTVIEEPDDAIATGVVATILADINPDVIHNHMYRAELVGTRAAIALGAAGHRRPYIVSTVHSSRIRSEEDRRVLQILTPQIDQLIAVSKAIETKILDEGRTGAPVQLIYNGVDLSRYDETEPCCTFREQYGIEPDAVVVGVVARLEPEKGHPTLLEAGRRSFGPCPTRRSSSWARAAAIPSSNSKPRRCGLPTGSRSPAGAMMSRPSPPPWMSPSCPRIARPRACRSSKRWRSAGRSWPAGLVASPR